MNPCPQCGKRTLWDDNMWYGCNSCGGAWHIGNPHPNSPPLALVRDKHYNAPVVENYDDGHYDPDLYDYD